MSIYSSIQADFLITYYTPKMIGKPLSIKKVATIEKLEKITKTNGKSYMVTANGMENAGRVEMFLEIGIIAERLGLPTPDSVLTEAGLL